MKKSTAILFLLLFALVPLSWTGHSLSHQELTGHSPLLPRYVLDYTPVEWEESCSPLPRRDAGFYHIYGYTLKQESQFASPADVTVYTDPHEDLILLQFNLSPFRDMPLSEPALEDLDHILSAYSDTGHRLILRFLYDWEGRIEEKEPGELELILTHMEQTAQIYNRYTDSIFLIQGLYTGNYGEMNGSRFSGQQDLVQLYETLSRVTDPAIYLSVRTPAQWRAIREGVEGAFSLERLGLYNDGMLGSDTDLGTYQPGTRERELDFQDSLCDRVPNGGEVVISNPWNDLETAIHTLARMHVSYLGSTYDPDVLHKWQDTTYTGQDIYHGMSGLEYIALHLGYRYVLRDSFPDDTVPGTARVSVRVDNVGFAPCYEPLTLSVTLFSREGHVLSLPLTDYSAADLPGGGQAILNMALPLSQLRSGTYQAYLKVEKTRTKETVAFANNAPLEEHGYCFGTFTLYRRLTTLPRKSEAPL